MTPEKFKSIRLAAGLKPAQLADLLRSKERNIYNYENGTYKVSGPVQILMEMIEAGTFGANVEE